MSCARCGSSCQGQRCADCEREAPLLDGRESTDTITCAGCDRECTDVEELRDHDCDVDGEQRLIADGGRVITVCPECDSADIHVRAPGMASKPRMADTKFLCETCGHNFDDGAEREARSSPGFEPGSPAGILDAADPDDLVTDGGGYGITLDRTHVRNDDGNVSELWKATVDNAEAYDEMGGETPGRALRALAREFDDVFGAEPRTDGGATMCDVCQQPIDRELDEPSVRFGGEPVHVECLPNVDAGDEIVTDGGTGAVDNDYDDARKSFDEDTKAALEGVRTEPMPGAPAIDLVTRQVVFVHKVAAPTVEEYYEREGFNLATYKTHPYLGVTGRDTVYNVVYVNGDPQGAQNVGKEYAMPRSRLMHIPVEQAWQDGGDDR